MMLENDKIELLANSVQDFLRDLAIGHSPATVGTYKVALSRFLTFLTQFQICEPAQTATNNLKTDWAIEFLRWVAAGQPANSNDKLVQTALTNTTQSKIPRATLATYGAALTRFYTWCGTERKLELTADESARLARRMSDLRGKIQRSIINKVPTDEVIERLLEQARQLPVSASETKPDNKDKEIEQEPAKQQDKKGLANYDTKRHIMLRNRNIALLETLKSSGARVSELCGLSIGDLDNTNHRARVVGKGSKERWIYFSPTAWNAIQEYLQVRSTQMHKVTHAPNASVARRRIRSSRENESQPLFARHDRGAGLTNLKPLSPRTIENMLWQLVEEAGLQTYITPHKFRHWFATRMLAATGDLATTQDLLGHASPTTTRIYAQVSEQNKQAAHQKVFDT